MQDNSEIDSAISDQVKWQKASSQSRDIFRLTAFVGFAIVVVGLFMPFLRSPIEEQVSWLGKGDGIAALFFVIIGCGCLFLRHFVAPLFLSLLSLFFLLLDILITYDLIAIKNGVTGEPTAPFRLIVDIFWSAMRLGNGAFFIVSGFILVAISSSLAIGFQKLPSLWSRANHDSQNPS